MVFRGSRLQSFVSANQGAWSDLGKRMAQYLNPGTQKSYRINTLYKDGHNITINTLTALLACTNMNIDCFVDFEPHELPKQQDGISGNNNIINSSVNDCADKIEFLQETIRNKNELLASKDNVIALLNDKVESLNKRYDDLVTLYEGK